MYKFRNYWGLVGGVFGVAFASAGLSQALEDALIPDGTSPIAAFLTAPTRTDSRVNATSATFAEMAPPTGTFMCKFHSLG